MNFELFLTLEENCENNYSPSIVSIFKRLSINIGKHFSVIGQLVAMSCFKPLKRSRDLVVKSASILTFLFCISIVFGYL